MSNVCLAINHFQPILDIYQKLLTSAAVYTGCTEPERYTHTTIYYFHDYFLVILVVVVEAQNGYYIDTVGWREMKAMAMVLLRPLHLLMMMIREGSLEMSAPIEVDLRLNLLGL